MQLSSWWFFWHKKHWERWCNLTFFEASMIDSQDWQSSPETEMGMHFDFRNPFDRTFFTTVNIGENAICNPQKSGKRSKFPRFCAQNLESCMPCAKVRMASSETKWKTAWPIRNSCSRFKGMKRNLHFFLSPKSGIDVISSFLSSFTSIPLFGERKNEDFFSSL